MYEKGQGVSKNYSEAVNWYRKAADQGDSNGQNNLGIMYRMAYGVERDYQKALELFRQAAERGNGNAQNNLGIMYKNGYGVPKDHEEAVAWYRRSSYQGNRWAQYSLGWMYQHGAGVTEDRQEALKWYQKAAAQGHEEAKKALSRINPRSEPGEQEVRRPDFGGDHSFSYVPPSGWKLVEWPDSSDYRVAHGEIAQGFAPNIGVTTGEGSKSLELNAKGVMASAKAKLKGFAFLEKSDFTTSDGVRGIKLVFESDDPSGKANKGLRFVYYLFNAGTKGFVVACSALVADGKKHDPTFDSAMKTFRIIKTSGETPSPVKQGE
jgi:tetratricopeptide (TPR) repeat protein